MNDFVQMTWFRTKNHKKLPSKREFFLQFQWKNDEMHHHKHHQSRDNVLMNDFRANFFPISLLALTHTFVHTHADNVSQYCGMKIRNSSEVSLTFRLTTENTAFEFWISDFFPLAPSVMVIIYDEFWRNEFIWMEDYSLLNNKNSFFFSEYFFACHRFLQVQLDWLVIDNSYEFLIRNVNVDTCNLNNWYH